AGVAQSLAGMGFRLAALRQTLRQGGQPDPELDAFQAALTQEQRSLQDLIARLRNQADQNLPARCCDALATTLEAAERRWGIETTMDCGCPDATFSAFLLRETQQLVSEAIANAVKHGQARRVDLTVRQADGGLELAVVNPHHADHSDDFLPQTISERVELLGGRLAIASGNGQTQVRIWIPAANDL
ncbi:MAG: sensor histidine kinase, partial [Novosphingobium sp.]